MGKSIFAQTDCYQFKNDARSSHALILKELHLSGEGKSVLDVGCARGHLAAILSGRGYKVTGIDNNAESLVFAKNACSRVIKADLENWPADITERFDYVIFADCLEHLRDPLEALRRILPLLKDGGTVLISVPNVAHLYVRLSLLFGRWDYAERGILDETHLRFFTRTTILGLIKEAGISLRGVRKAYIPWNFVFAGAPQPVRNTASLLEAVAGSIFPNLFAYQWIISGTKHPTLRHSAISDWRVRRLVRR